MWGGEIASFISMLPGFEREEKAAGGSEKHYILVEVFERG
jgi:hypothetical protein